VLWRYPFLEPGFRFDSLCKDPPFTPRRDARRGLRTSAMTSYEEKKAETLKGSLAGNGGTSQEALFGLAAGAVFGMISPLVGHPFDTVKTRMQAEVSYANTGFLQTVMHIYKAEGARGFYRGFIPPLVGSIAFRGLLFSAYSGAYAACEQIPVLHDPLPYTGGLRPSVIVGAMAAAFSRAVIESPLDFVKVRIMVGKEAMLDSSSSKVVKNSMVSSFRLFSASPVSSIRHVYHGFFPTLFRTMGLLGSFFVMVDYSVRYIPDVVNAPVTGPFFKGGVCATAAWVFAFPFESVKSVIQADTTGKYKNLRNSTWVVMRQLHRERGIKGLYRGFAPGASRSFVANGVSMSVYTWFQNYLRTDTAM
jgi:solute carrier family 25 carnitine/acylcarnitine transporter 20/29